MGSQGSAGVDDRELVTWWGRVVEAYERTGRLVAVGPVAGVDLPGPWFEVLLRLLRTPGGRLTMTQLARETTLTSGGFTKLADRLEQAGLIERQPSPSDRRVTNAVLTPLGRAQAERAFAVYCTGLRELVLQRLGLDGLHVLADHMSRLSGDLTPGD